MTRTANAARRPRIAAAAALLAGTTMILAACGGTAEGSTGGGEGTETGGASSAAEGIPSDAAVYEFEEAKAGEDQVPFSAVDQSMVIQLPDDLEQMIEEKGEFVPVENYVVTSKSFGTGMCRTDTQINYRDGGKDVILNELVKDSGDPVKDFSDEVFSYWFANDYYGEYEEVAELPSDEELTEDTLYVTEDREQATLVRECGAENYFGVTFQFSKDFAADGWTDFADAEILVNSGNTEGGHMTYVTGDILGKSLTVGPSGSWQWAGDKAE